MQLTKFVIVKHIQDNGKYLFKVPKNVTLEAGDKIVCDTSRGNDQLGICCCDSFLADAEMMCRLFGTQVNKLRWVTGRVEYDKFDPEEDDDDGEDGQQDCWGEV